MRAEDQTVCVSVCDGIQIKVIIDVWLSSGLQNSPSFPVVVGGSPFIRFTREPVCPRVRR